jgi:hypothetical protein
MLPGRECTTRATTRLFSDATTSGCLPAEAFAPEIRPGLCGAVMLPQVLKAPAPRSRVGLANPSCASFSGETETDLSALQQLCRFLATRLGAIARLSRAAATSGVRSAKTHTLQKSFARSFPDRATHAEPLPCRCRRRRFDQRAPGFRKRPHSSAVCSIRMRRKSPSEQYHWELLRFRSISLIDASWMQRERHSSGLKILGQSSAAVEPSKRPLHDPASWQDPEAFDAVGSFDDFDRELRQLLRQRVAELWP